MMLMKSLTELIPSGGWSSGTHVQKVFPPRASCTLEVVGGIVDRVTICNMACLELHSNAADPVIDVEGLGGVAENRGMKPDEVIQRHQLIALLSGVAGNDLLQLVRVSVVSLNLHQNLSHRGWGWKIAFLRIIPTSMDTTKMATGSVRHPKSEN